MQMEHGIAKRFFRYEPETGKIYCVKRYCNKYGPGDEVGTRTLNYIIIGFDFKRYPAHRLAWLLMTGEWPEAEIDHRNHDKHDNRWINLRPATRQQNAVNVPTRGDNTSGAKGVGWHKLRQKWRACVTVSGKQRHLGLFDSKEAAIAAYSNALRGAFGEYAWTAPGA